jgi:molybdopterin synthase sulfur carrier subunit
VPRGYVKVLKEGRDIQHLQGLDTALAETDTLSLFPPVGGG